MPTTLTALLAIGDKVYILVPDETGMYVQCPWCAGAKVVIFQASDGSVQKAQCPKCQGVDRLYNHNYQPKYNVVAAEVTYVSLCVGLGGGTEACPRLHVGLRGGRLGSLEGTVQGDSAWVYQGAWHTWSTDHVYWLNKADAESVAARLSNKD